MTARSASSTACSSRPNCCALASLALFPSAAADAQRYTPTTMTPEAKALAAQRIAIDIKEATLVFARAVAEAQSRKGSSAGYSSAAVMLTHNMARTEIERRALTALDLCQRLLDADDSPSDDDTRNEIIELLRSTIIEQSEDVDALYDRDKKMMGGSSSWPSLDEARE